jgi:hypothetical protein
VAKKWHSEKMLLSIPTGFVSHNRLNRCYSQLEPAIGLEPMTLITNDYQLSYAPLAAARQMERWAFYFTRKTVASANDLWRARPAFLVAISFDFFDSSIQFNGRNRCKGLRCSKLGMSCRILHKLGESLAKHGHKSRCPRQDG